MNLLWSGNVAVIFLLVAVTTCLANCSRSDNCEVVEEYPSGARKLSLCSTSILLDQQCYERYDSLGKLVTSFCLQDDLLEGEVRVFDPITSAVLEINNYSKGARDGKSRKFLVSGQLSERSYYCQDRLIFVESIVDDDGATKPIIDCFPEITIHRITSDTVLVNILFPLPSSVKDLDSWVLPYGVVDDPDSLLAEIELSNQIQIRNMMDTSVLITLSPEMSHPVFYGIVLDDVENRVSNTKRVVIENLALLE